MKKIENLLKIRYKVIADYPNSEFKIGSIITPDAELWGNSTDLQLCYPSVENYPHLFKKLEWWEERAVENMPKYLKLVNGYVCEVTQYLHFGAVELILDGVTRNARLKNSIPATKEEYEAQNKNQ